MKDAVSSMNYFSSLEVNKLFRLISKCGGSFEYFDFHQNLTVPEFCSNLDYPKTNNCTCRVSGSLLLIYKLQHIPFILINFVSIQYNTIQYNTIQYNTIQYNTIQYNTIQYNTIQYNTIQYNTIQ